jgi:asparagine synthase (glutamine-hydrolysing)
MCGIVGIISNHANQLINSMVDSIEHRGPDDSGIYNGDRIALGHRRLSIVDLSPLGHQPMVSECSNYILIYNGEIYNHNLIREDLIKKGYVFKGLSDTETLLNGYIEYGRDILNKLNGIFAFAVYSKNKNELLIARDQFGVKPLYYMAHKDAFLFSSELKSLIKHPTLDKSIDHTAIMDYINFLYSPAEKTPFTQLLKVAPGHYILYDLNTNTLKQDKYYDIPFTGKVSSVGMEELSFQLEKKLFEAVERQLMSDVPIGFFLSGGLDSSLVVAIAKQLYPEMQLDCFTIDSGEGKISNEGFTSDLYYAKLLSEKLKLNLNIVDAKINILSDFDKMIWYLDEPQADPAPLNVLKICQAAKNKGIKVLLGGTAGDDLFSGYRRHQALNYDFFFNYIPNAILTTATNASKRLDVSKPFNRRLRKFLHDANKTKLERMAGYFAWLPYERNLNLYSDKVKRKLSNYQPNQILFDLLNNIPNDTDDLNKMLYWEMKTFLMGHNLNYTDKMSMAVGVEVRVPFLDLELVKFSTTIPVHLKLKGKTTKYILKKVAEKYLPTEIIYRPKSGFGAPVRKWINEELDEMISERLSYQKLNSRGIFNPEAVLELIKENKEGRIDASYTIWSLLAIESWMQQFID